MARRAQPVGRHADGPRIEAGGDRAAPGDAVGEATATRGDSAGDLADRLADHESIDRLADELIPALIAKLGASGLGELEVREGAWRVRLRRPRDAGATGRRNPERSSRGSGQRGAGHAAGEPVSSARPQLQPVGPGRRHDDHETADDRTAPDGHRDTDAGAPAAGGSLETTGELHGEDGSAATPADGESAAGGHGRTVAPGTALPNGDPFRVIATSPAVGFFQPRPGIRTGSRVRAGDPVAAVDVLGILQEVTAPADGIVGVSIVEPGEPVEYGQELLWVELLERAAGSERGEPEA